METHRWAAYEAFCLAKPIWRVLRSLLRGRGLPAQAQADPPHPTPAMSARPARITIWSTCALAAMPSAPVGSPSAILRPRWAGLIYLENSHHFGRRKEAEFTANSMPNCHRKSASMPYNKNMGLHGWPDQRPARLWAARLDTRWLLADYEARRHGCARRLHHPCRHRQRLARGPHSAIDRYSLPTCKRRDRRSLEQPLVIR